MSDKLTDKLVGSGVKPELSPNPNGSGYTKQVEVDALSSVVNPEGNVLYICQGRKYKYLEQAIIDPATNKVLVPSGWVRVENGPQVHNVDGGRGTPVHENVQPQVPPRIFNEPVALNGGVTIKGKTIEETLEGKNVVVKTIKQTEPNWSVEDVFNAPSSLAAGLEYTKIYSRLEEINGIVYIVLLCEVKNTTSSSVSADLGFNVDLDEEIAKQIYDFAGKSAHEESSSNICSDYGFYGAGTELASAKIFTLRNTSVANRVNLINASATSVPANSTMRFSFRSFLTLK